MYLLSQKQVFEVIQVLLDSFSSVYGPQLDEGHLTYNQLQSAGDLPMGYKCSQSPGRVDSQSWSTEPLNKSLFQYNLPAFNWKRFLSPPRQRIWRVHKKNNDVEFELEPETSDSQCFLGIRACDLKALQIYDTVQSKSPEPDRQYWRRRQSTFLVAVNCTQIASTCFCTSQGGDPQVDQSVDMVLTEWVAQGELLYLLELVSPDAKALFAKHQFSPANSQDIEARDLSLEKTRENLKANKAIVKSPKKVGAQIAGQLDSPAWEELAKSCLSCANCTLVCPTCFCTDVEEVHDIAADHTERWVRWDSCFNASHFYLDGGGPHQQVSARYRQWLSHKFSTWWQQFDSSGCVGCGRCISWCPVGIDVRDAVNFLSKEEDSRGASRV